MDALCGREPNPYERAAATVRHALHGRRPALPTRVSYAAQRVYHSAPYRWLYTAASLGCMALAAWEPVPTPPGG